MADRWIETIGRAIGIDGTIAVGDRRSSAWNETLPFPACRTSSDIRFAPL
jgi:hypothetical protein